MVRLTRAHGGVGSENASPVYRKAHRVSLKMNGGTRRGRTKLVILHDVSPLVRFDVVKTK